MTLSWSSNCGHTDVAKKKSFTFSAASHCHPYCANLALHLRTDLHLVSRPLPTQPSWKSGSQHPRVCHEPGAEQISVSEWRPQHFRALLVSGRGWDRLSTPLRSNLLDAAVNKVATERFESASVPNLRLAQMDFDAGISPLLTLDQVEDGNSSVRAAEGVQVVEEAPRATDSEQLPTRGVDQVRTTLASTRPFVHNLSLEGRCGRCRVRLCQM